MLINKDREEMQSDLLEPSLSLVFNAFSTLRKSDSNCACLPKTSASPGLQRPVICRVPFLLSSLVSTEQMQISRERAAEA